MFHADDMLLVDTVVLLAFQPARGSPCSLRTARSPVRRRVRPPRAGPSPVPGRTRRLRGCGICRVPFPETSGVCSRPALLRLVIVHGCWTSSHLLTVLIAAIAWFFLSCPTDVVASGGFPRWNHLSSRAGRTLCWRNAFSPALHLALLAFCQRFCDGTVFCRFLLAAVSVRFWHQGGGGFVKRHVEYPPCPAPWESP